MSANLGSAIAYLDLDANKFSAGLKAAGQQLQTFSDSSKSMGDRMSAMGNVMQGVGANLTKAVTVPLLGIGTASVAVAANFEAGMSKVSALSGATGDELKMLEEKALEMGSTTKYSSTEASEALQYMALAGFDANQMASALEPTLKLAGSAGMDLARASDIVTDTLSMFGMEAQETAKMTDVLAYAQANSNTNVEQLGEALKYCGASANAMGYDIQDTAVLLGTFADQGLKGSSAGTTLNSMFRDMKKNAKDGAIAIGEASVAIIDGEGNYRDMVDILADVELATKDMTQAERDMALSSIWGTEALKGVNMAFEAGSDKIAGFENELRNADGTANDMYDTMQDNLKGSIDNFKSALEGAGIAIGKVLSPAIKSITEKITDLVSWFNGLDESTQGAIVTFGAIAAAIGPLLMVFGSILTMIPAMSAGFTAIGGTAGIASAALAVLPVALGAIAVGIGSSANALDFLRDKLGVFGSVVGSICEFIYGAFQLTFGNIIIIVSTAAEAIMAIMSGKFSKVDDIVKEGWAKVENNTAKAMSNMAGETSVALAAMEGMAQSDLDSIVNTFDTALQELPNLTRDNVSEVATVFKESLVGLDDRALTILRGTSDTMAVLFEGIKESMDPSEATKKFEANLKSMALSGKYDVETLQRDIDAAMKTINNNVLSEGEMFKNTATDVFNQFKTVGQQGTREMAQNVVGELQGMSTETFNQLTSMGSTWAGIFQGINLDSGMSSAEMTTQVLSNLSSMNIDGTELVNQLRTESVNHMKSMEQEVDAATKGTGDKIEQNIKQGAEGAKQGIAEGKAGVVNEANNMAQGVDSATKDMASDMGANAKAGAKEVQSGMQQASKVAMDETGKIPKDVKSNMDKSVQAMRQAGSDIYNGMNTSFSKLASQGKQHFSDLYNGTTRSSSKMASKVIADWESIKSALSETITGNVQIKVTGVQEALNQINSVKNAAQQSFAISNTGVDDEGMTNLLRETDNLLRTDRIASRSAVNLSTGLGGEIKVKAEKEEKKAKANTVNVSLNIDKFVNERKQDVEQLIEEINFVSARKMKLGGA